MIKAQVLLQDLKDMETLTYDQKLVFINARFSQELERVVKNYCRDVGHIGRLQRIADFDDPQFEAQQFGYKCTVCDAIKTLEPVKEWAYEGD